MYWLFGFHKLIVVLSLSVFFFFVIFLTFSSICSGKESMLSILHDRKRERKHRTGGRVEKLLRKHVNSLSAREQPVRARPTQLKSNWVK